MEMRRGESPHRSTALMNKRKPIVYFQKKEERRKRQKSRKRREGYIQNFNFSPRNHDRKTKIKSEVYIGDKNSSNLKKKFKKNNTR